MHKGLALLVGGVWYSFAFYLSYLRYLNPDLEYQHYYLIDRDYASTVLTFALAVAPLLAYGWFRAATDLPAIAIYVACYVPGIFTVFLALDRALPEIRLVQLTLMLAMSLIFLASRPVSANLLNLREPVLPEKSLGLFAALVFVIVLGSYAGQMRWVSFENVYDIRYENAASDRNFIVLYMVMWLSYAVLPFFLAYGLKTGNRWWIATGIGAGLVVYMSTGAKAAFLLVPVMLAAYLLLRLRGDMLTKTLLLLGSIVAVLVLAPWDTENAQMTRAVLLARALGSGGWSIFTYYEFFDANPKTYFSHINIIQSLFGRYPYGNLTIGNVIGTQYAPDETVNFNASFWATDGLAALGLPGVLIVSAAVAVSFFVINWVTSRYDTKFVALVFTGFAISLINASLFMSLLSGGAVVLMLLFVFVQLDDKALRVDDVAEADDARADEDDDDYRADGADDDADYRADGALDDEADDEVGDEVDAQADRARSLQLV